MGSSEIVEEKQPAVRAMMKSAESYKILKQFQLAKGDILYKAEYIKPKPEFVSGEVVAIKVFKRQRLHEDFICVANDIERSKLSDHKNVTRVHCSFMHDDDLWVVMPYEHMASLARIVASRSSGGGLSGREVGFMLREVLEGLDYLHGRGWMHKGFELSHVFVDTDGGVRIDLDSLAYDPDGNFEDPAPAWLPRPPEILDGDDLELKSDVWSFGIVALRLALGYVPARSYEELANFLAGWPEMLEKKETEAAKKEMRKSGLGRRFDCFSRGFSVKEKHVEDGKEAKEKKISPAFEKMVVDCLNPKPWQRPSTRQLMEYEFFRELQCQNSPCFLESLLV